MDLGSGYGRFVGVGALLRPDVEFVGYEINPKRFDESKIWLHEHFDLKNVRVFNEDFGNPATPFPEVNYIFSYDTLYDGNTHSLFDHMERQPQPALLAVLKGSGRTEKYLKKNKRFIVTRHRPYRIGLRTYRFRD